MNNKSQEIDLMQMIYYIFRKWRIIVVGILIGMLLFGAGKVTLGLISINDKEEVQQKIDEYNNLINYNRQTLLDIRKNMSTLDSQIYEQRKYINESLFMKIDPFNVYSASARFYIKTDYTIMPSMTYQNIDRTSDIVNAYVTVLSDEVYLQEIADEIGTDQKYIKELVSVYNSGNGILGIDVISPDEEKVQTILTSMITRIYDKKKFVEDMIETFDVSLITNSAYMSADSSITERQYEEQNKLYEFMTAYSEEQAKYISIENSNIEEPEVSFRGFIKGIISASIVGMLLGAICIIFILCVKYLFPIFVYSSKSLNERYNRRIIARTAMCPKRKYCKFDRFIRNLEERVEFDENAALVSYNLASAMIENELSDKEQLLIAGTADEKHISEIVSAMKEHLPNINIIGGGNLVSNAKVITACAKCDAVMLVEQCNYSKYSDITLELDHIEHYGKNMIGFFVLED